MKNVDADFYKQRLTWFTAIVLASFAVLFLRLFHLQIIEGEKFRRLSQNNRIRLQYIEPPQGLIFDRNGELMVDNRPSFDLNIVPKDAQPVEETLRKLATLLSLPPDEFLSRIQRDPVSNSYLPVIVKQDIGREALAAVSVRHYDLPGVQVRVTPHRHYIGEGTAAHLIGYLSEINQEELGREEYAGRRAGSLVGKVGIEKTFETILYGKSGGQQVEIDATGQLVQVLKTVEARPGNNIYLSIDLRLQQRAEELLEGKTGAVVALDPDNGEALALASSPSFNPNQFIGGISHEQWDTLVADPHRPLQNKFIQGEYPPASTYKILTALAGLEKGVIQTACLVHRLRGQRGQADRGSCHRRAWRAWLDDGCSHRQGDHRRIS